MKWRHLAQFSGTIVSMPGSNHQIWLAGLLAQPYYQSSLSGLSLIATLGFYVLILLFLMYVDFNYRVNENFTHIVHCLGKLVLYLFAHIMQHLAKFHCFSLPSLLFIPSPHASFLLMLPILFMLPIIILPMIPI